MAPALTEAGQSQNFKTLPSTSLKNLLGGCDLSPAVVTDSFQHAHSFKLDGAKDRRDIIVNSGLPTKTDEKCKNLTGRIIRPKVIIHELPDECISEPVRIIKEVELQKNSHTIGKISMNNSAPMGDQSDNMGLLKSSTQNSFLDDQPENVGFLKPVSQNVESNFMKEKSLTNDMDQLFKNFSAAITGSDIPPGDFAPPNVEELLQVIKSMENNCESSDTVLDTPSDAVESDGMFPLSGTDLATFERELLDDMMTNFDDPLPDSGLDIKESLTKEKLDEVCKRQFELERKCERLQRRLKKLQARCIGKHAAEELTGLFEHAHRLMRQGSQGPTPGKIESQVGKDKKIKGVSELTLATLVNRLTVSTINQASGLTRYRPSVKYFGSGSIDASQQSTSTSSLPGSILPKMEEKDKEEVKAVAQQLYTQVHMLQNHLDSDVTASSSGGESCDEMQNFNNPHQTTQPIVSRAMYRWARDRASIATRWSWLQTQITDLEYKIRQYTEFHRQIRVGKGPVILGEEPNVYSQQRATPPVSVNGYHGTLPGVVPVGVKPNDDVMNEAVSCETNDCDDSTMTACRTRPFLRSAYRKRKLLNTANLHLISKKAARPVSIRCACRPPLSCAVCTGRIDPTRPDRMDSASLAERISLLDYSYHPVLSFPSDVSLSIHLEAIMRLHEWQVKANRCNVKLKFNKFPVNKEKDSRLERRERIKKMKMSEQKNLKKIRKQTAAALSAKLKKKLSTSQRKRRDMSNSEQLPLPVVKTKKPRKHSVRSNLDGESEDDGDVSVDTLPVEKEDRSSRRSSPEPSSGLFGTSKDRNEKRDRSEDGRKRREDDSYDIDNIVIPYSMAAATRVEKLQYKEILTPKWRVIEAYDLPNIDLKEEPKKADQESETEDISDEVYLERHNRCEESEKKKFMSYIKLPLAARTRTNRRTDSRAESSGANTPDPMSPLNAEHSEVGAVSPMATPPATPLNVLDEQCQQNNVRKRTVSNSRWNVKEKHERASNDKDKEDRCLTPEFEDEVQPYEPRVYPLSNEVYEEMLKAMPNDHAQYQPYQTMPGKDFDADHRMPESPSTSSTISAVEEDPNDPEWTIMNGRDLKDDFEYRARSKR